MKGTDLRKLLSEATPGPWAVRDAVNERTQIEAVVWTGATEERQDGIIASTGTFPDMRAKPDARFIVAAHEAMLYLLNVVELARRWHGCEPDSLPDRWARNRMGDVLIALDAHLKGEVREP